MKNIPSISVLKEQASRLASYLGEKHRIRIKPASSLEAIAALYRTDWNTLAAISQREAAPSFQGQMLACAPEEYPLLWARDGRPSIMVSRSDWFRHTLAIGVSVARRREWLQEQYRAAVERGNAGLFVNIFEDDLPAEYRAMMSSAGYLVDLTKPSEGRALNLLADLPPEKCASVVADIALGIDSRKPDLQRAMRLALETACKELRLSGQTVSLASLVRMFSTTPELALPAPDRLKEAQPSYSLLSAVLNDLAKLPWARTLFSDRPNAKGLETLLNERQCLAVDGFGKAPTRAIEAVLAALSSAVAARLLADREARTTEWVVGIGESDHLPVRRLTRLVEQARSARTAVLLAIRDIGWAERQTGSAIASNAINHLYLEGCDRRVLMAQIAALDAKPTLVQPGRIQTTDWSAVPG